jgi:hypothetical protein
MGRGDRMLPAFVGRIHCGGNLIMSELFAENG